MNPKQLKKARHRARQKTPSYIHQLSQYGELFDDVPQIKYLVNNALLNDRLLKRGLLPQPLPKLLLPDDIQDQLFHRVNARFQKGDPEGDRLWDRYVAALPKLDRLLRNYRDYLEETYGMWSYTNSSFTAALSDYLANAPVLEVMAGNGYISKGLREHNPTETVITTDSKAWVKENQTGRHPVTKIESLDALSAIKQYGPEVQYVIMAWAPDKGEGDLAVLKLIRVDFPNLKLLVIGEKDGATNSPAFWQTANLSQEGLEKVNAALHSFDLIDEQVYLAR